MSWRDDYKLGVATMDQEHRGLIQAIDALELASGNSSDKEQIGSLLLGIMDCSRRHFASEEWMMTTNSYPGTVLHKLKHQYLQQQLEGMMARLTRTGFLLDAYSCKFLSDWVVTHIQKEDRNFALWLNENGKR